MIPWLLDMRVEWAAGKAMRLWIPLFVVWVLLLPVALLLLPFFLIGCLVLRMNPFVLLTTSWQMLMGFRGLQVEMAGRESAVMIRIA